MQGNLNQGAFKVSLDFVLQGVQEACFLGLWSTRFFLIAVQVEPGIVTAMKPPRPSRF